MIDIGSFAICDEINFGTGGVQVHRIIRDKDHTRYVMKLILRNCNGGVQV